MTCNNLTFKQARLIYLCSKRKVIDPIAWVVFFLLFMIFSSLFLLEKYGEMTLIELVPIVIPSSFYYTLFMMIPVYINLNFLMQKFLNRKGLRILAYTPYVIGVLVNALLCSWVFEKVDHYFPPFLEKQIPRFLNLIIVFGIQLISTGLIFKRQLISKQRDLLRLIRQRKRISKGISFTHATEEDFKPNHLAWNTQMLYLHNERKTEQRFIPMKSILFIEADLSFSNLYYKDDYGKIHKVKCSENLTQLLNSGMFPTDEFIQIQRGFIVAKRQVKAKFKRRKVSYVVLKASVGGVERNSKIGKIELQKELILPIGTTYEHLIDLENWYGFQEKSKEKEDIENSSLN